MFLQLWNQSVERSAEALSDPPACGQVEGHPTSTPRRRWKISDVLWKTIQPARFWYHNNFRTIIIMS